jgi:hypothetical protein
VWLEGEWRTLKMNQQLGAISLNSLRLIAATQADLPAFVSKNRPQVNRFRFRRGV